jgi:hypothetical protein
MKSNEKHIRRIRFSEKQLEGYRSYFSDISFQRFVANAVENEIRRKQKKRLVLPF